MNTYRPWCIKTTWQTDTRCTHGQFSGVHLNSIDAFLWAVCWTGVHVCQMICNIWHHIIWQFLFSSSSPSATTASTEFDTNFGWAGSSLKLCVPCCLCQAFVTTYMCDYIHVHSQRSILPISLAELLLAMQTLLRRESSKGQGLHHSILGHFAPSSFTWSTLNYSITPSVIPPPPHHSYLCLPPTPTPTPPLTFISLQETR